MCPDNMTKAAEFLLMGFHDLPNSKIPLLILFLLIYIVILCGNIIIIFMVTFNENLQIPMFYFLKHLGVTDLVFTTNVIPMMLHIILNEGITVSLAQCTCQYYVSILSGCMQCFLLAVMSYDRYLAVCHPLHYISIMSPNVCHQIVIGCWLLDFILITSEIVLFGKLQFCGLNSIDHFFCDFGPLVELSTSDTSVLMLLDFAISMAVISIPFAFIIGTYICIFIAILRIRTRDGRQKTFSTCSSHLTVVCTYYGTLMAVYMGPSGGNSLNINKFLSLLYIVITPVMNPIIYSLRNKEIRETVKKYVKNNLYTNNN
ncbi:hypothetical protein GDO86_017972 [Hymenochirus boettgeri]|uniref:G-protein coupled receptors family 1 profile domain-containing protein n=1 Tax=Hymenochirus boettgeri TaxID=247094 RepID=A0A8T2IKG6_9PIPI|nr:hypothetical protein GDO86_017972 [Hymenochirus boettgeri]